MLIGSIYAKVNGSRSEKSRGLEVNFSVDRTLTEFKCIEVNNCRVKVIGSVNRMAPLGRLLAFVSALFKNSPPGLHLFTRSFAILIFLVK